jgi:hypothetical protein
MITIRPLTDTDMPELGRIHEQYEDEFSILEFNSQTYISKFIVCDDNIPVSIGGIRNIAELVAVTDKNLSARMRRDALVRMLDASSFIANKSGHESIHVFVQNKDWEQQLTRRGFRKTKGASLYYPV